MPDISWCGGISEAKKIASAAETMFRPGRAAQLRRARVHAASLHLAANVTNLFILETVRRHYDDEYRGLVTNTYPARDGAFDLPSGPGLGIELTPETLARPDATIERFE